MVDKIQELKNNIMFGLRNVMTPQEIKDFVDRVEQEIYDKSIPKSQLGLLPIGTSVRNINSGREFIVIDGSKLPDHCTLGKNGFLDINTDCYKILSVNKNSDDSRYKIISEDITIPDLNKNTAYVMINDKPSTEDDEKPNANCKPQEYILRRNDARGGMNVVVSFGDNRHYLSFETPNLDCFEVSDFLKNLQNGDEISVRKV